MRAGIALLIAFTWALPARGDEVAEKYDALYDAIMVRDTSFYPGYTDDPVAPLVWKSSRFLIEGESRDRFAEAIDGFVSLSDEELARLTDFKRAIMQRHLWAVFDIPFDRGSNPSGAESEQEKENQLDLQRKIAVLLKRLALPESRIAALPDPVAATSAEKIYPVVPTSEDPFLPFFPAELSETNGPWVCVSRLYHLLSADMHSEDRQWRSVFHIFIKLPGGLKETLQYLKELGEFKSHWITEAPDKRMQMLTMTVQKTLERVDVYVNPETPQFPTGTQFALVERALLISDSGKVVTSPLINGVQLRAYLRMDTEYDPDRPHQALAEFVMQPRAMMDGTLALRAIETDEKNFRSLVVSSDPFEKNRAAKQGRGARLRTCMTCHSGWGIHSVLSRSQLFGPKTLEPPTFTEGDIESDVYHTVRFKNQDYSWGFLQGLWQAQDAP